jgi:hypothetical protein
MKLLISSADLAELERVVKQLVWAFIPCAVCKDPISSHLSVWIQQDIDFPLAVRVSVNRDAPRRLPHWARAFDSALPATQRSVRVGITGIEPRRGPLVQSQVPTWMGTTRATPLRWLPQLTGPAGPASSLLPGADRVSDPTVDDVELACAACT